MPDNKCIENRLLVTNVKYFTNYFRETSATISK